jgi:hypothetical protein
MAKAKEQKPNYLVVKRVISTEECYDIRELDKDVSGQALLEGLQNGELNLEQSQTVESLVFVVNKFGRRVATLGKDGGCGPDHEVEIKVEFLKNHKVL